MNASLVAELAELLGSGVGCVYWGRTANALSTDNLKNANRVLCASNRIPVKNFIKATP
jgi:hypothetical protein